MANARPMLGDIELQQVQIIDTEADQVLVDHAVPALEGDFWQRLDRRANQIRLRGVLSGAEVGDGLNVLREKFHAAEPVSFVTDIITATKVDEVLIEEMGVREVAGRPERFEYAFTLREYIPAEEVVTEDPPPDPDPPPRPDDPIDQNVGTLIVTIIVEDRPNFDFSRVTVTLRGATQDGETLSRTLSNRTDNVWTEEEIPASQDTYTVAAVVTGPAAMSGSTTAQVRAGQTTQVTITLRSGVTIAKAFVVHYRFDNSFIEPCMRLVMQRVARYAADPAHNDEKLVVVGHTDKVGDDPPRGPFLYNQSLSERRARGAFAYLTFGHDPQAAIDEWTELRQRRTPGRLPSIHDTWGAYQYQYMLQDLGFYRGNIDGDHGSQTDMAINAFRCAKGLPPGQTMDDPTWAALIRAYLEQDNLQVSTDRFLPNCSGEILKWVGCGEESPTTKWGSPPKATAWRPYRRTEFLFVRATELSCEIPQPDTFDLPQAGSVANGWCVGPTPPPAPLPGPHCCFLTYDEPSEAERSSKWWVQLAEPGMITPQGTIRFENFPPQTNINFEYVLIAPDGEFVDGEVARGDRRGEPQPRAVSGTTNAQGVFEHQFSYADKPEGIYTLEIRGKFLARLTNDPPETAVGNVVCQRLNNGDPNFNVTVIARPPLVVNPTITLGSSVVVVKKPYTNPARQPITLSVDYPFCHGEGTFTRSNDNIRFFTAAEGGNEITFDGVDNVFSGLQLMSEVKLFAEGAKPSGAMDDVQLLLTLTVTSPTPGAPVGPAATRTMTAVELTLDIHASRPAPGVDSTPLSVAEKINPGRFLGAKTPGNHQERAMLVVHPANPASFTGDLVLNSVNDRVQAFTDEIPASGQTPLPNPYVISNSAIPPDGVKLWAQGVVASETAGDTGFQLGLREVEKEGDRVVITVIPFIFVNLIDDLDRPIQNTKYRLEVAGQTLQGTTDSQGTVVQHVPLGTQTGKLILDKLFHRRQTGTGNLIVDQWHIDLQLKDDLDAAGDIAGTKARLNNLGLFAGTQIDNNLDAQTRRALERFQTLYGIQVTGTLDENTKQKLKEKHGS